MERCGLKDTIIEMVRQGSLRWLGHVLRKGDDECGKKTWNFEIEGSRGRGRTKMSWESMTKKVCFRVGLYFEDAKD